MGAADSIPGVSGGTIAFITGIYERLLNAIKSINITAIRLLLNGQFIRFWSSIDGTFLLILFSGIAISLFSIARLMVHLLENQPIVTWSFFFGLILVSAVFVLREVKQWSFSVVLAILIGVTISFYITIATPASSPQTLWFVFLSAALAICAMILPGISGAFILLLLGQYKYVMGAIHTFDITLILIFVAGAATGLLSFVRILSWLLSKFYNIAIGVLSGFMIGSLNKIWPWKMVTEYRINSKGEQVPFLETNISPNAYLQDTGSDPLIIEAFMFAILAIGLVFLLEFFSYQLEKRKNKKI